MARSINRREDLVFAALTGIVAAGLGIGVAELLTGLLSRSTPPVLAVSDAVIDRTPAWLREWAIDTFGVHDKTVLIVGVFTVIAVAAAAIGIVARFNRVAGAFGAALLGVVAVASVAERPDSEGTDIAIAGAAGLVAVATLWYLTNRQPGHPATGVAPGAAAASDPQPDAGTAPSASLAGSAGQSLSLGDAVPVSPAAAGERVPTSDERASIRWGGSPGSSSQPGRRRFVQLLAGGAGAAVVAAGAGQLLGGRRRNIESARENITEGESGAVELDLPQVTVPDGADLATESAEPWQTPNPTFYRIDTTVAPPLVHPDDWRLRIHGMVDEEIELDFEDLLAVGLVDSWVTLCCVSNLVGGDLIGNALWTGVRIADVLGMAGPAGDADAVMSTSHDGWTCGTTLDVLTDGRDALFAVAMNGEPLPIEHGFPVRMVVPGLYGYVSATKWLVDLEVTRFEDFDAYWTTRGWSELGPIKVQSRIDVPSRGASLPAGKVPVAGVAWAQHRGIDAVEVRVDEGEWQLADLGEVPSADTWRQWVYIWDAGPGDHTLEVRATTSDGEVQTGESAPPAPDGATGWHSISVSNS